MTANSSDQAGYLAPLTAPPAYDEELEREISQWVRALTGLPEGMVRPLWKEPQPTIPPLGTDWAAFGVQPIEVDDNSANISDGDEADQQWQHENITILVCFYGRNGMAIAAQFRDGLRVSQNNAELNRTTLSYGGGPERIIPAPELINNQWVRRYDITVNLRRKTVREYGIKSLLSAPVQFFGD